MLTGDKGSGKSTLINHFFFFFLIKKIMMKKIFFKSKLQNFYKKFKNNIFSNIIYLNGSDFKNVKIDDIRNLKK